MTWVFVFPTGREGVDADLECLHSFCETERHCSVGLQYRSTANGIREELWNSYESAESEKCFHSSPDESLRLWYPLTNLYAPICSGI